MKKTSTSEVFVLKDCIIRYPHVFKPQQALSSNELKFSVKIYIIPTQMQIAHEKAKVLAESHFQNKEYEAPYFKWPYVAANQKPADALNVRLNELYVMNPKAGVEFPPSVVDSNKQPLTDNGELYSGCVCAVGIRFFTYEKMGNIGIGVGLVALMKTKDGEPLEDNAPDVNELFSEVTLAPNVNELLSEITPAPHDTFKPPFLSPAEPRPPFEP
ncbi:MAG: DUF2815 family protein [Candidatus Thiodiazotropha sp. (ex Lucinoma aequizonata)]|nr:DUF2815 family protein [Candidatus Thiodiazotropha sp. (ex Lucinoma aequizonata)]